jgi:mycothiol synthase
MFCGRRSLQTDADLAAILELAALADDHTVSAAALPYQLSSWACEDPANVRLWTVPTGELVAFAIFQIPFGSVYYGLHPQADAAALEATIFAWAKQRAADLAQTSDRPVGMSIWPRAEDIASQARLAHQGYVPLNTGKVFFQQPLTSSLPAPQLPAGFTLRPLAGETEVEAATDLLRAAFNITSVTPRWRRRILEQAHYRPDLDLVAVAPDGRLAAFCLLWLHPRGHLGQIEPMATHPDFQRLGLGRAIICEGLRRVQAHGATAAVVGTSSSNHRSQAMYQAAGFREHYRRVGYHVTAHPLSAITPDTITPDTIAPDTITPDTIAPDSIAPDSIAPK